jgi:hypothetical protein
MSTTDVTVTVTVHDSPQRTAWANTVAVALTVLLVAYAFGWLGWLVAAAVVYIAARVGWWWYTQQLAAQAAAQREHTAIAARADQQHAWVLAGDDRGIYGKYPPAAV